MAESKSSKASAGPKASSVKGARVALTDEEAQKVGFFGIEIDPTPDENYTVAGQLAGKPVPETDAKAAEAAKEASK